MRILVTEYRRYGHAVKDHRSRRVDVEKVAKIRGKLDRFLIDLQKVILTFISVIADFKLNPMGIEPYLRAVLLVVFPYIAVARAFCAVAAPPRVKIKAACFDSCDRAVGEPADKSVHALSVMLWVTPICTIAINVATLATIWIAGRQIMVGDVEW